MSEPETQPGVDPDQADPPRLPGKPFTTETARDARKLRGTRSQQRDTDADIERGLRARAKTDPRAAEILLRWLQRPRDVDPSDNIAGLSTEQLETLHHGLMRLCSMPADEQAGMVRAILDGALSA